jgi:sRNA-binding protein
MTARLLGARTLRLALRAYCGHGAHLRALIEGAPRIDLDGAPSGHVTTDAALAAAAELQNREAVAADEALAAKTKARRVKPVRGG